MATIPASLKGKIDQGTYDLLRAGGLSDAEIASQLGGGSPTATVYGPDGQPTGTTYIEGKNGPEAVPPGIEPQAYAAMSPSEKLVAQIVSDAKTTRSQNQAAIIGTLGPWLGGLDAARQQANTEDQQRIAMEAQGLGTAANEDLATLGEFTNDVNATNLTDQQWAATLGGALDQATKQDQAGLSGYMGAQIASDTADRNAVGFLGSQLADVNARRVNPSGYGADVTSAAGVAAANPADIVTQTDALRRIQSAASAPGISSQAATAAADPGAVALQDSVAAQLMQNANAPGLSSRAAGAQASPVDIASQRDAITGLGNIAAGTEDLTSRAAGAAADQGSIAAQDRALSGFEDYAGGGHDLSSLAAGAAADQGAIDAQHFALDKYKSLTDPSLTAQERFMMEQARQAEEQDRRAALDARLRAMETQGVRGSGAEIGAMLGAQDTTSRNRMLQDLGAQAQAEQRALSALDAYTGTAGNIRNASFGEDLSRGQAADAMAQSNRAAAMSALTNLGALGSEQRGQSFGEEFQTGQAADAAAEGNRDARIAALENMGALSSQARSQDFGEQYQAGSAADEMAALNRQYAADALGQAGALGTTMRGQSFGEQFQTGTAADQMAQGNRDFAADMAMNEANLGTTMRNEGFNEAYQAGSAEDVMSQFNKSQSLAQQRWADELNAQQNQQQFDRALQSGEFVRGASDAAYNRATGTFDAQQKTTQNAYDRSNEYVDAQQKALQDAYTRDAQLAAQRYGVTDQNYGRLSGALDDAGSATQTDYQRAAAQYGAGQDAVALLTNQYSGNSGAVQQGLGTSLGLTEERRAEDKIDDDNSLLGKALGLLGI